tara:strand:- start:617 stop:907 length:291 start_codon:yes stop_codon:yes gene_type:complete
MAIRYNEVRGAVGQLLNLGEKEYRLEREMTAEEFKKSAHYYDSSGTLIFILTAICTQNKKARDQLMQYINEKARSVALLEKNNVRYLETKKRQEGK